MISNLPNIINIERKSKVGSPKSLYVSVGPITPIPGPILDRHEREVDMPSIKVKPGSRYKVTKEPIKKMIMNIKKKTPTLRKRFSSRTLSPILSLRWHGDVSLGPVPSSRPSTTALFVPS